MSTSSSTKSYPRLSKRYTRNTLVFGGMWLSAFLIVYFAAQANMSLPIYVLGCLLLLVVIAAVFIAFTSTHPTDSLAGREIDLAEAGIQHVENLSFITVDGIELAASLLPGINRAAVILLHTLGGRKEMMIYHAAALRRAGFAALMLDLRAHGESGGEASTGGWLERDDLQTVIDALGQREDIDRDRIGVLGISLGAKVALLAAARAPDLRAVAAEGASPITLSDYRSRPHNLWRWIGYPLIALSMQVKSWMSGAHPDTSLHQAVQALASRPLLLISCGQGTEKTWTEYLSQVASGPTRHWNIPFAHHAAGYFEEPEGYEEQMAEFFRRALVNDLEAV